MQRDPVAEAHLKRIRAEHNKVSTFVLDPRDPMQAARTLVATRFMNDNHRLLHRHRGTFWRFANNHYVLADQEMVRAEVWRFLEQAQRLGKNNRPEPFRPNRARVSDVLDALSSVCNLDNLINSPAWLNGADRSLPAAAEMFPVANGLLHLPSGELYPPTPDYFGLTASNVVFDPDAPDPAHWFAFLTDLFGKDEQAITALQDWFGYNLSPDTRSTRFSSSSAPAARARAPSHVCLPTSLAATASPTRRSQACKQTSALRR
jgi:putative DNA primase/helicase